MEGGGDGGRGVMGGGGWWGRGWKDEDNGKRGVKGKKEW